MPQRITVTPEHAAYLPHEITISVATEEELLEFCNRVRKAGGANIIEALLPSRPADAQSCLIANALNFSCIVDATRAKIDESDLISYWEMQFPVNMSHDQIKAICDELNYDYETASWNKSMVLPEEIGNAAWVFDLGIAFQEFVAPYDDPS